MRYTRYNYKSKSKKKVNFILCLAGIVILAIIIGGGLFKTFFQQENGKSLLPKGKQANSSLDNDSNKTMEFGIIQCGLYSKKEVAQTSLEKIPSDFPAFIVEDSGNYKVMAGIYLTDNVSEKMNTLKELSIDNFRIKCNLPKSNEDKNVEDEIIGTYLQLINKVCDKKVKCIDTKELKQWVSDTAGDLVNQNKELKELVDNIESIPDEYKKENAKESIKFVYNLLIKYKG